jgi:hypothetical protein
MLSRTTFQSMTPAQRAHTRRVIWLLVAYALVLPPLIWLRANRHLSDPLAIGIAIVASLPVLGIFASWGRYLSDEKDEYHHAIVMRRNAIATNTAMGAATVWGFLQAFGVMPLVEAYWIPVVWCAAQGFAALFSSRSAQA